MSWGQANVAGVKTQASSFHTYLHPSYIISLHTIYHVHTHGTQYTCHACSFQDVGRREARTPSPHPTTPISSGNNSSMLKSVLLGKEVGDDFDRAQERARVSSISGRPVRLDGVGIVIGNESSSESEDEEDDTCKSMVLYQLCSHVPRARSSRGFLIL